MFVASQSRSPASRSASHAAARIASAPSGSPASNSTSPARPPNSSRALRPRRTHVSRVRASSRCARATSIRASIASSTASIGRMKLCQKGVSRVRKQRVAPRRSPSARVSVRDTPAPRGGSARCRGRNPPARSATCDRVTSSSWSRNETCRRRSRSVDNARHGRGQSRLVRIEDAKTPPSRDRRLRRSPCRRAQASARPARSARDIRPARHLPRRTYAREVFEQRLGPRCRPRTCTRSRGRTGAPAASSSQGRAHV